MDGKVSSNLTGGTNLNIMDLLYTKMSIPKTDNQFMEYQKILGENYPIVAIEPPNKNGEYKYDTVGVFYISLYSYYNNMPL
jgi:hypothetical protein